MASKVIVSDRYGGKKNKENTQKRKFLNNTSTKLIGFGIDIWCDGIVSVDVIRTTINKPTDTTIVSGVNHFVINSMQYKWVSRRLPTIM